MLVLLAAACKHSILSGLGATKSCETVNAGTLLSVGGHQARTEDPPTAAAQQQVGEEHGEISQPTLDSFAAAYTKNEIMAAWVCTATAE